MQAWAACGSNRGRSCDAHRVKREHGRSNNAEGPARRLFPTPEIAAWAESLASHDHPGAPGPLPVLAGDPEHGRPGTAGPLSAIGAGLLLDAAQPDPDDGHAHVSLLATLRDDQRGLRTLSVRRDGT